MESRWVHGLFLEELSSTECLQPALEKPLPTTITAVKQTNDSTLMMSVNVDENCGYHFLGEIEVINNNTLNLVYHGYGAFASCNCCFGLTYKIALVKDEDYKFNKLRYVTVNGIAKTTLPMIK
ncbi:hypothetical protein [Ferruginibacter sp.]